MYLDWSKSMGDPEGKYDVLTGSKAAFIAGVASALVSCDRVERFDLFFAAALQGILARSTSADLMLSMADRVAEARRIARLCLQAQPGEAS